MNIYPEIFLVYIMAEFLVLNRRVVSQESMGSEKFRKSLNVDIINT